MAVLTRSNEDQCMPIVLIPIAAAIAFLVILCLVLWIVAEATGGADSEQIESRR